MLTGLDPGMRGIEWEQALGGGNVTLVTNTSA
jgi:hypothetical protein